MLIAFQGETGAYSEAAGAKFDPSGTFLACPAFEDVFAAVDSGQAACGVLPIENSIGGTIHRNYDLLVAHELQIVGEVELPVRHSLLALPGTKLEDLTQVYSHPQALAQCDRFLRSLQGRRDRGHLRHGRQRQADPERQHGRRRRPRLRASGRRLRPRHAPRQHPGSSTTTSRAS